MNFRKLLAFVLVFSLATQPGSVRFSYAEDTKAAKVKFEKKTEASDELAIEINESELDEYLFDPGSREQKLEEAAPVAAEETAKTSKISGALAGAIAAGVAAVTAVVGTAGLMIYNGVSNKDEIAKLWTSEEGSFFSHLGKTISILLKGVREKEGYDQKKEEFALTDEEEQASLFVQKQKDNPLMLKILTGKLETHHDTVEETPEAPLEEQIQAEEEKTENLVGEQAPVEEKTQPTGIDSVDKSLCDEAKLSVEGTTSTDDAEAYKEKERLAKKEAERKAKEEAERVAKEEAERKAKEEAERVAKEEAERKAKEEAERLAKEEAERKAKEEAERLAEEERNTKIISHSQKRSNWVYELVQNKIKLKRQTDRVQPQIDVLKEEDRGELQEELNKIKGVIEKATSIKGLEGLEGQLTTLAGEVEKAKAAQQKEMQNQLETIESQDEKKVDSKENNNVQQDNNEESNSREKEPTTAFVEEKKEPFTLTFNAQPHYRYEKKHVQKKIDEIKNTCGLNVTNLQSKLNSINLEDVATIEELRTAEENMIQFSERIRSLLNSCKTVNSNKDYIENNIQAVVDILDKSDVSLDHDWDELINKPLTEGNLEKIAEGYKNIADRVKAIIDNNNAIPELTKKLTKTIEDNKNVTWFNEAYYNEQLNNLSEKPKTEKNLKEVAEGLNALSNELKNVKVLDSLDSQIKEIISGFGELKKSYFEKETEKYVAKFEELQNMHDTDKAVEKLKQIKEDLQTKLVKLKEACQNNPKACGKE